ncbi:MAG: hypothetical protein LBH76_06250 [Propionibacteriaceae bacterium]|nr:hypothetical protein [Propionibacteriaceae bacterium]
MPDKIDFKKTLSGYQTPRGRFTVVDVPDMSAFTASRDKSRWGWTMMLMAPDWIDQRLFE